MVACKPMSGLIRPGRTSWAVSSLSHSLGRRIFMPCTAAAYSSGGDVYDLVVIGGGSGGLACSKEAAQLGKRVAVLDYVNPSPQGTAWGLGGTCVNVGCIPKKLMHQASLLGHAIKDSRDYGWSVGTDTPTHSWEVLVAAVLNHIKSLNFGHRAQLKEKNVDYFNAYGSFIDANTVQAQSGDGTKFTLRTKHTVVAVGGRPNYPPNVMGSYEYGITSDDLFFRTKPPGKTLVVGASYIGLECAGFLAGLGYPTSLMIRSRPLKAFDEEMASLVVSSLKSNGVQILSKCEPLSISKGVGEQVTAVWRDGVSQLDCQDEFDTVLFATGRQASTGSLNLASAGVSVHAATNKVLVNEDDSTTAPNIFAIGDSADAKWELTPVAIRAGKLLARRLFGGFTELMNYDLVPTTVFTPLEYASVGLSEEAAVACHGADQVEVYHACYRPLEYYLPNRGSSQCYIKLLCLRGGSDEIYCPSGSEKVIGLHLTGPNAGEVVQGFAVAMNAGLTLSQLESTLGIHPTCAEEIVKLHITKRSGQDPRVTGC